MATINRIEIAATMTAQWVSDEVDTQPKTLPTRRAGLVPVVLLVVASLVPTGVLVTKFLRKTEQCAAKDPSRDCVAFLPGDATSATKSVRVGDLKANAHKGDVLFVTIGLQGLNDLTLEMAKREPNLDLYTHEQIYGTRSSAEGAKEDLKLMRYSKDFAAYVALRRLGYPVKVTGGGVVIAELSCAEVATDSKACAKPTSAGAVLEKSDIITSVGGTDTQTVADLADALRGRKPGDKVEVAYTRKGEARAATIELMKATGEERAIIGFLPESAPPDTIKFDIPHSVQIESGDVGGPSAGLAFTLAILDELTPGELTGGVKVAATGEIGLNGTVGPIGGLRQKTVAVQRAGAKVFLVPMSEMKEAEDQAKGSSLKVVGVETLDDALKALADLGGNANDLGKPGAAIQP
jgi:Lon-like protease